MINGFKEAVEKVKYVINYGCFANDLSFGEIADDLTFVFDKLAKDNGEPEINWEEEEEEDSEEDS